MTVGTLRPDLGRQGREPGSRAGDEGEPTGRRRRGRAAGSARCRRCRSPRRRRRAARSGPAGPGARSRAWASTIAAVKALPFVTPMSVRPRSETPPAVTVAVSAPSPTVPLPSATARSTARSTRARPSAGDWSRWRAPKGTRTTCPTRSPPISTAAIVYGAQREAAQRGVVDAVRHQAQRPPDPGEVLGEARARVDEEGEAVPCGHDDSLGRRPGRGTAPGCGVPHPRGAPHAGDTSRGVPPCGRARPRSCRDGEQSG